MSGLGRGPCKGADADLRELSLCGTEAADEETPAPDNKALNLFFFFFVFCIMYKLFLAKASRSLNDHSELVALTSFYELS